MMENQMHVQTQWVDIPMLNEEMKGYLAYPKNPKAPLPAVIVLMEIFGINNHIQDVTRRFAEAGYLTLAIDYYHRVAPGIQLDYTKTAITEGREYKSQVTHADMLQDITTACDYLMQHPFGVSQNKIGLVGFCFGGYAAFVGASLPKVAATVCYYGAGIPTDTTRGSKTALDFVPSIHGEMLCLFGEQDESIPKAEREQIEAALTHHQVRHQCITYPQADHGFFCDQRSSYEPAAAKAAWQTTLDFLQKNLQAKASIAIS